MDPPRPPVAQRVVPAGHRGILAHVPQLDRWLHIVLVALVASSALRYVSRHGLDLAGALILVGAIGLIGVYAARPLMRGRWQPAAWVAVVTSLWGALTLVAPSFAWTAVPLAFAAMEVLAFSYAVGVVMLMTVVGSLAWLRIGDGFDPTVVVGPIGIALVTVMAYRALEQEASTRQRLLDELTAAQDDLAAAQRHTGALAERTRLSREIHDSVGQGLTSINLLLSAAEQAWDQRPDPGSTRCVESCETSRRQSWPDGTAPTRCRRRWSGLPASPGRASPCGCGCTAPPSHCPQSWRAPSSAVLAERWPTSWSIPPPGTASSRSPSTPTRCGWMSATTAAASTPSGPAVPGCGGTGSTAWWGGPRVWAVVP